MLPKKIILILVLALVGAFACPVFAIDITGPVQGVGSAAGFDQSPSLPRIIGRVVQGLLALLGIVFMGYVIYAGQLWMTARGNEEQISKAKAIIRGSIVGLLIIMAAYLITAYVLSSTIDATGYGASPKPDPEPEFDPFDQ